MNQKSEQKNIIFIGKKDTIRYISTAVLLSHKFKELSFVARGNNIKRAIDACQITLRDFLKDWVISDISLGTDKMEYADGSSFVSTIKIIISGGSIK